MLIVPDLRRNKDIFSYKAIVYNSPPDALADAFFISINLRRIDMTIPRIYSTLYAFNSNIPSGVCHVPNPTQGIPTPFESL